MTSFIQPSFPTRHGGVDRFESALSALQTLRRGFDSTNGLGLMLLAAMAAAFVVVADQLIDTWADGHLLVAWVALWLLGFVALAVFSMPARRLALGALAALNGWSASVAQTRAEERLWALAKADPRLMADLDAAHRHSDWQ